MVTLKVVEIDNCLGIILDEEALAMLGVRVGDLLHLTAAPGGAFRITPDTPDFERQMRLAEEIMRENEDVLRELGRS